MNQKPTDRSILRYTRNTPPGLVWSGSFSRILGPLFGESGGGGGDSDKTPRETVSQDPAVKRLAADLERARHRKL